MNVLYAAVRRFVKRKLLFCSTESRAPVCPSIPPRLYRVNRFFSGVLTAPLYFILIPIISHYFVIGSTVYLGSGCDNIRVRVACLRGAGVGRRGTYCYIERVWASMEEKNTTPLTQEEIQPIQKFRKNHWKNLLKFILIYLFFILFGFFLYQLIDGTIGLLFLVILFISAPALGITFSWGNKKEETKTLLLQVQEYAESRGITVKEFVRIYENMRLSVKIVPKTFLVMGIILLLGGFSFCVFCVFSFHYIFNNQLISIYNEQWNDTIKSLVFGITFLLCGILYIICYARKRKIPCKTFRVLTVILIPAIPILTLIGVPLFIL